MPLLQKDDRVVLQHPKGASAEILYYGATVISWKAGSPTNPQPTERLFVSGKAALDGSKPVRGGIPVVFPAFGAPTHPDHAKLSQHGFARNNVWAFGANVMDNEAGVSVKLTLAPNDAIKAQFDHPFELEYVVTLAEHQLTTGLHVKHTGLSTTAPFEFQALFHNYIRAPANDVRISPLSGISYYDKTEATEEARAAPKLEARAGVDVNKFTDSVYEDAGGRYDVVWPSGAIEVRATNLKDVVVWNPQQEAGSKIGDMEAGGWEKYVCVEPGYVRGFVKIEPGQTWSGQQVLSVKV
ncbi:galactose mutarotase-like protein [Trametes versicolor FP-101664 SS1]|uniref:galactose mutarotase-like protein n=1 Tax=Trametes versicolor (strain FP-101664) TaxID=717944 RepID=UPI0004623223|nr:galactose mutarotase-like protein [Trametes versicolor FP-101664 SS1]EIW64672.1 galactose mutarotase-like protein [Trametes versicolor FP-101664 SS1]